MNREIKFRIWDVKNKCFTEEPFYRWTIANNGYLYNSENDEWHKDSRKFIVNFFSGIKGKNGKEIYEGDILKVPDDYETYGFMSGEIREVIFAQGGFRFKPKKEHINVKGHWLEDDKEFEVIGNIYQNPEKLK